MLDTGSDRGDGWLMGTISIGYVNSARAKEVVGVYMSGALNFSSEAEPTVPLLCYK